MATIIGKADERVRTVTLSEKEFDRLTGLAKEYSALMAVLPVKLLTPLRRAARYHSHIQEATDSLLAEAIKQEANLTQSKENITTIVSAFVENMELPFTPEDEEE